MKKIFLEWSSSNPQIIWLTLFSIIGGSFIISNSFSFSYETGFNDHYQLIYFLPYYALVLLIAFPKRTTSSLLLLLGLIILNCFLLFNKYYDFYNQHFFILFSIFCLFLTGIYIGLASHLNTIVLLAVVVYFYELTNGITQIIYNFSPGVIPVPIMGTLQNSGIFACYVVIGFPFVYYLLSIKSVSSFKPMFWVTRLCIILLILVDLYILFLIKSRTSLIALILIFSTIVWQHHRASIKQIIRKMPALFVPTVVSFTIFLSIFIGYYLFYFRRLSAFGRLMKWEITFTHWDDHFWFGTGLGRFTWYYPQWQAQYFQTHVKPPSEYFLSSGESFLVFNEYLQLFKEVGFVGFVAFGFLLFYFFISKSSKQKKLLDAVKATATAILACGFTSYPLHVNAFLLLLFSCFLIAFTLRENNPLLNNRCPFGFPIFEKMLLALVLILFVCNYYFGTKQLLAVNQWNCLQYNYLLTRNERSLEYAKLYPSLKYDGKFMTEYGRHLSQDSVDCLKAVEILEQAKRYFISRTTIEATGTAYWQIKNYEKSIENFTWLSNFLPHLFKPKFKLLKLYKESNQKAKARQIGEVILKMPVKIPSINVDSLKSDTREILNSIK